MNSLRMLRKMGFVISWKVINYGLHGAYGIPPVISYDEVYEFLIDLLDSSDGKTDDVISLICEKEDKLTFDKLLDELANSDETDSTLQIRKWRAYLLKNLLDNISNDYTQGLLELMEFWTQMPAPKDLPMFFPALYGMTVNDFFSQEVYSKLIERNKNWLQSETSAILAKEAQK